MSKKSRVIKLDTHTGHYACRMQGSKHWKDNEFLAELGLARKFLHVNVDSDMNAVSSKIRCLFKHEYE